MGPHQPSWIRNGAAIPLAYVPRLEEGEFRRGVIGAVDEGARVAALFGDRRAGDGARLYAVLAHDARGLLSVTCTEVGESYRALTPDCPEAHLFEREIAEQWGIRPEGHPWLKPVRFHASARLGKDAWGRAAGEAIDPAVTDFYRMEGPEAHEVAVGPVHAGVIEPGHFRFQCHGEDVFHLEISLGYQHRGVERRLSGGPDRRSLHYAETLAGDTTIGHATAYCQAVEALAGVAVPARAHALRAVALELERLANHTGDLGALAHDVAFLPTASFCGRLRGDFLNLTAELCGNRFGRAMLRPGGVGFDLDPAACSRIDERIRAALCDVEEAARLLWESPSVQARFEDTGRVPMDVCLELGLVGPAARACGVDRDVRRDFPSGIYSVSLVPLGTWHSGDVFARAYVRSQEIVHSVRFVREQLASLPAGPTRCEVGALTPGLLTVSLVEGWRGEICHVAITGPDGRFCRYKVVDPSFHNWMGLAMALRDQPISDFPLCNKSFNLSYCGHDL